MSNVLESLAVTESGGNFGARNAIAGSSGRVGHFGRLQFGRDRFDDAVRAGVIPRGMTIEQFGSNTPEGRAAQQRAEVWHKQDMIRQAERMGLTQYIGQEVGGIPITMDAILAMGHLGGMGGARAFLTSGGQRNPRDAFGTSLADYARRHGNASEAGGASASRRTSSRMGAGGAQQPPSAPQGQQNALAAMPSRQEQAQAMMQQFGPKTNALDPAAFQRPRQQTQLMGFGQGQNPFNQGMA